MDIIGHNGHDADEAFYTIKEAAKLLRIAERTLRRNLQAGKIRGYRVGRQWRIPRSMIERMRSDDYGNPPEPKFPDTPFGEYE